MNKSTSIHDRQSRRTITASDLVSGDTFAGAGSINKGFIPASALRTAGLIQKHEDLVRVSYTRADGSAYSRAYRPTQELLLMTDFANPSRD